MRNLLWIVLISWIIIAIVPASVEGIILNFYATADDDSSFLMIETFIGIL